MRRPSGDQIGKSVREPALNVNRAGPPPPARSSIHKSELGRSRGLLSAATARVPFGASARLEYCPASDTMPTAVPRRSYHVIGNAGSAARYTTTPFCEIEKNAVSRY